MRGGAEGQNRTGDTMIFSHVLYQLSYLGTDAVSDCARFPVQVAEFAAPAGGSQTAARRGKV
jgi:hypothetical protein